MTIYSLVWICVLQQLYFYINFGSLEEHLPRCQLQLKMIPIKVWVHLKISHFSPRRWGVKLPAPRTPTISCMRLAEGERVWVRSPVASQIAVAITGPNGFTWWPLIHRADISHGSILAGVHSTERRLADFSILSAPGYRAGQKIILEQLPYVVIVPNICVILASRTPDTNFLASSEQVQRCYATFPLAIAKHKAVYDLGLPLR